MTNQRNIQSFFDFISASPTAYHAVESVKMMLKSAGYTELFEGDKWELAADGKYFVTRNGTSIIAFRNKSTSSPFMIVASHSDSPSFRVKSSGFLGGAYSRIGVERYGSMMHYTWFDRPLSIAGRVVVKTESGIDTKLINLDKDLATIPSVAIHMNRSVNESFSPNPAVDLLPLVSLGENAALEQILAHELSVKAEDIVSHHLFVYNRDRERCFGANGEYFLSPRFDNLGCVYTSAKAFLNAEESDAVAVLAVFDNEEVGSGTKQGAASTFLSDVLERIIPDREQYMMALASSFMVSADNAHAKHPNHPELADAANAPMLGGGVVIKYNANQKYTTDAVSAAIFEQICARTQVKTQNYYNRADIPGGSTLGSIANTKVAVPTVDIGMPQLAMHSATETGAVADVFAMENALTRFYSSSLEVKGTEIVIK